MSKPSQIQSKDIKGDIAQYIKNKKIDSFIGCIIEDIIREKPENSIAFSIESICTKFPEETKLFMLNYVNGLTTNSDSKEHNDFHVEEKRRNKYTNSNPQIMQTELNIYLDQNNINKLFSLITESILLEKPNVPSVFVLEYLLSQYPVEGRLAAAKMNPTKFPAIKLSNSQSSNGALSTHSKSSPPEDLNSDEEDDEADYSTEAKDSAPARAGPRRFSVSSESLDVATIEEQMLLVAHVPKDREVADALFKVVSKSPILRKMLDPEQRELIVRAFAGPVVQQQGVDVIRQGENGDMFYLLEEGEVDVFITKTASTAETKVHTYKSGDAFGQLALMYNAPRAATCRVCSSQAKLWTLDRVSFKVIIASCAVRKRKGFASFLSQVPILQSLSDLERLLLADSLSEETFENGAVVCRQGDQGEDLYLIREGGAVCTKALDGESKSEGKRDEQRGVEEVVKTLTVGEYFGEIALLTSKPRQATVKAKGTLKVLAIDRSTFTRVLGSMEEIMKRNMEQYTKYSNGQVNAAHNVV